MAVNPAVRFPTYYGNTQAGGNVYVPGNPNNSTPNGAFGPFGQDLNNELANPGNIFGSDFNGFFDPLNLANNYAITPLKPPAAPGFSPGTMPTQNFTNNDFGDFNTPSMQATAGGAHPGILVQPPAPPPAPPPPAAGNVGGGPVGSTGLRNLIGLNSSDFLSKGNTSYGGDTPAPHTGFAHLPPPSYLKSKYGQTPNTAISKSAISVPASYNSTTSSAPPSGSSAANVRPTVRLRSASPLPVRPIGGVK